jgi:hypothetical protein
MLTWGIAVEGTVPSFRCPTLRPGIFDTDMQAYLRSRDGAEFPDGALFRGFKDSGLLEALAARLADRLVVAGVEHGRTDTHQDL